MDTLPEISLGSAALAIFGICAAYMLVRGLFRTILSAALLTLSAWVGFRVWQQAPSLAIAWTGKPSEFIANGLPIAAFLATFIVSRRILRFVKNPFSSPDRGSEYRSPLSTLVRLVITIIPAALLILTAATFIHHISSVAEVRASAGQGASTNPVPTLPTRIKHSLSAAIPANLMDWLDPLTTEPRLRLAKMIASDSPHNSVPMIDPETGRPYPRAIVIDDPELNQLAEEGRFSTLLRHPLLTRALEDPNVRKALGL